MLILSIEKFENGAHDNVCPSSLIPIPDNWAVVPESVGTIATLENFVCGGLRHWLRLRDREGRPAGDGGDVLHILHGDVAEWEGYTVEDMLRALTGV